MVVLETFMQPCSLSTKTNQTQPIVIANAIGVVRPYGNKRKGHHHSASPTGNKLRCGYCRFGILSAIAWLIFQQQISIKDQHLSACCSSNVKTVNKVKNFEFGQLQFILSSSYLHTTVLK